MAFCGNCGLQLPPHASECPRCGMATDSRLAMDESHPYDPTIAVLPTPGSQLPTIQATPTPPASTQPTYISQPGATIPGSGQTEAPTYITPLPPVTPQISNQPSYSSNPGYPPPSNRGASYEPPAISGANYQARGISSPGYPPPPPGGVVYQPIEPAYAPAPRQHRSVIIALILFFIALLFVGGALGVLVAKREGIIFGATTPTPVPTSTQVVTTTQTVTSTPTPGSTPTPTSVPITQQAQTLLKNYYSDINNKDYQDAYAMLGSQLQAQQSYSNYASGFSNTQQDTITITNTSQQADGSVRLDVTLNAAMTDGSTQTYTGYYIIGTENGSLKILQGHLQQA